MALANWKTQLKIIDDRLAVLNPLLVDLGLPPQAPPPFHAPPETGQGAGDARHKAAEYLQRYRLNLDKQIENAKKAVAAGKGKSSERTMTDFYKADDTSPRDFGTFAPASAAVKPHAKAAPEPDAGNGLLYAALAVGAYFLFRR